MSFNLKKQAQTKGYGLCPRCGAPGISRERRIDGNDMCENRHTYPSKEAIDVSREDLIDREYLEAVERNDEEKAQRLVDEWQAHRSIPEEESEKWWDVHEEHLDMTDSSMREVYADWMENKGVDGAIQPWRVFPAARLKKIYNDFVKNGWVSDERGLNNLADLICENIFKLNANTLFMGHTPYSPVDMMNDQVDEEVTEADFEGFENYIIDKNSGQWRISDYAMEPLMEDAYRIIAAQNTTDRIIAVDRAINRIHQRSDIAKFFVEGGTSTLNQLAGKPALPMVEKDEKGNVIPLSKRKWASSSSKISKKAMGLQQADEIAKSEGFASGPWYHGTKADFSEFKVMNGDLGIHFGNKIQANWRLERMTDDGSFGKYKRNDGPLPNSKIYCAWLNISHSLYLEDAGDWSNVDNIVEELYNARQLTEEQNRSLRDLSIPELSKFIQSLGWDSILYTNKYEGLVGGFRREPSGDSVIVFDPSRIKIIAVEPVEKTASWYNIARKHLRL
ncbi:MAG: hypothetical protein M0R32_09305 [Candidatus Cloacimonetes bacterium]|jgi:hypothetical protein|nr:hypothetical protein [Candidatus Cloacimonadota bacterium]